MNVRITSKNVSIEEKEVQWSFMRMEPEELVIAVKNKRAEQKLARRINRELSKK